MLVFDLSSCGETFSCPPIRAYTHTFSVSLRCLTRTTIKLRTRTRSIVRLHFRYPLVRKPHFALAGVPDTTWFSRCCCWCLHIQCDAGKVSVNLPKVLAVLVIHLLSLSVASECSASGFYSSLAYWAIISTFFWLGTASTCTS